MEQFNIVLGQEIIFLTTIIIGYGAFRLKFLGESSLEVLSKLFSNVTLPFLIFVNSVEGATRQDLIDSLYVLFVQLCMFASLIIINKIVVRVFRMKGNSARIYQMCATIGNMGFVGIPLLLALFGQRAMMYIALFTIIDQAIVWSYGVSLSYPVGNSSIRFQPKKLINPPLIATLLAFIFIFFEIDIPTNMGKAFTNLSNASIPLPFLYIGGVLAASKLRDLVKRWEVYVLIVFKMSILPILAFLLLRAIGLPDELVSIYVIVVGLPALAIAPMLARNNGSDETLATAATTLTTLASIVTVPLVSYVTTVLL